MKDEALRLALEALKHGGCPPDCKDGMTDSGGVHPWGEAALIPCPNCKAITAIKQALEQPEPEPVAWGVDWGKAGETPCVSIIKRLSNGNIEVVAVEYGPKRKWQGLTQQEQASVLASVPTVPFEGDWHLVLLTAIEAKLKEKNT